MARQEVLPTVKVLADSPSGFLIINESEFREDQKLPLKQRKFTLFTEAGAAERRASTLQKQADEAAALAKKAAAEAAGTTTTSTAGEPK